MKYCKNCNTEMNDDAVFCPNCGAKSEVNVNIQQPAVFYAEPKPQPVSIGGFIGRSLIPLIPFVGGIIYIIMLFVWGGDKTKEESFRNWAKAQLIMIAIGIVLGIIVLVCFF